MCRRYKAIGRGAVSRQGEQRARSRTNSLDRSGQCASTAARCTGARRARMEGGCSVINEQRLREEAERGLAAMLRLCGEDPSREGLFDTPGRVVRAMQEMTAGLREGDPASVLGTTFER